MINNTNQNGQKQVFLGPALKALGRGLSVLPLGKDKKALVPWKEYQNRLPTVDEVESWARQWPDANLGIITGEISGLTVIDCDSEEARRRLDEHLVGLAVPEVKTPKGYHLYFRHRPGLKNGVGVLPSTDIRNDGGYVVAPPSVNADGVSYKWIKRQVKK